jgi:glycosyltransferase involved in cell wall biosynthesis
MVVVGRPLGYLELLRLYLAADCYVSAHWGEGWGLPLAEAMAVGLPVVATNFSGNTQFMTKENSFLVPVARMERYV